MSFSQPLWYTLVLEEADILQQDKVLEDMLKKTKTLPFGKGKMAGKGKKMRRKHGQGMEKYGNHVAWGT